MKKSQERRSMTAALVCYSRMGGDVGCSTPFELYRRIEGACGKDRELALDLWALHECLLFLRICADVVTLTAIREIYLKPFLRASGRIPKRNEISYRILRFSQESYLDERTVYRRLQKARRLWLAIRFGKVYR